MDDEESLDLGIGTIAQLTDKPCKVKSNPIGFKVIKVVKKVKRGK